MAIAKRDKGSEVPIFNSIAECPELSASWTSGDYIALAALGVALITGIIAFRAYRASIRQLEQNQRHNELAVRPLLDFDLDLWAPDGSAGIWLANHGYGAAILKGIGATLDGETFDFFDPMAQRSFSRAIPYSSRYRSDEEFTFLTAETHRGQDSAIPNGTRSSLMLIDEDTTGRFRASLHGAKGMKLWAKYEDLYGNQFEATFENSVYEPISAEEILLTIEERKAKSSGGGSSETP